MLSDASLSLCLYMAEGGTMFQHPYVFEKLIELEKRRASRFTARELPPANRRTNRVAVAVGLAMQQAGERLDAWAGPSTARQSRSDYSSEPRRH
jgi:hypothetical protein